MEQGQTESIEVLLGCLSTGIAVLDSPDLRIRYLSAYLHTQLEKHWHLQDVTGQQIDELLPEEVRENVLARLHTVIATGQDIDYAELPYEGFLHTRGRTYWHVALKRVHETLGYRNALVVIIEDVTEVVRSRILLHAIKNVSSAIAEAYALPLVLDRILYSVREMVSATRCAILLVEHALSEENETTRKVTIAAQHGVHVSSQDWHPIISKRLLLGRVEQERRTLVITDASTLAELDLPLLNDSGTPRLPSSVLCVPIFGPPVSEDRLPKRLLVSDASTHTKVVLGSIEVYHLHVEGFAREEIELLEQFAQQAGLAIQNTRLFRNVNQLARAERRSAHQRAYVMQAIPDGVIIFDPRWRVAETNQAIRILFGWTNDILGLTITQALHQSTAILYYDVIQMTNPIPELERRAHRGVIDEFKMMSAESRTYTIRCTYTPIRDDLGDTFAFVVIYHDVTEQTAARERIEAEVRERTKELAQRNEALQLAQVAQEMERARLALLLERLPSGVLLVSAIDNSITVINQRAVQLIQRMGVALEPLDNLEQAAILAAGASSEKLLRPIQMYGASNTLVRYEEQPLSLALKSGRANEAELHAQDRDGRVLYLFASAAPLRTTDGTVISAVLVYNEITTIKMLERAREDFFTTMAHELKTPLANIRAHLSALLVNDVQWSAEEQHSSLRTANKQVERLVGMVNNVLNASRIEAGALHLTLDVVFLPELFEDLKERLEALIVSSRRHLHIMYPDRLPAVRADYESIMSVLTNLISNAFRYAPEGDTVLLEAELVFDPDDMQQIHPIGALLCVSDKGPGISQEQQKLLFTRFRTFATMNRAENAHSEQSDRKQGQGIVPWSPTTGLGLYISRGIVEAHGSKLLLESKPGQGTRFSFTLPAFKDMHKSIHT